MPREFCVDIDKMMAYFDGTEGDSSCVLFHKLRNWDALLVTTILNGHLQPTTYRR